jgi:hypothetical protein
MFVVGFSSGYLEHSTEYIVDLFPLQTDKSKQLNLLTALTHPFTDLVVQVRHQDMMSSRSSPYLQKEIRGRKNITALKKFQLLISF